MLINSEKVTLGPVLFHSSLFLIIYLISSFCMTSGLFLTCLLSICSVHATCYSSLSSSVFLLYLSHLPTFDISWLISFFIIIIVFLLLLECPGLLLWFLFQNNCFFELRAETCVWSKMDPGLSATCGITLLLWY